MSETVFLEELAKLGIFLTEEKISQFRVYAEFLMEYNQHTNITAIKDANGIYLKHFYDSLLILKYENLENKSILDIGSGGGFPGVPLKICIPSIELTVLDSNGKKTKFLEELKTKLGIDFEVINDRAEKYIQKRREYYDVVTSRAVAALPVLAELCIPFVKVDGKFISYKGVLDETLENGKYAIEVLGGLVEKVERLKTPIENSDRSFIFVEKKCKTDAEYPRVFDKINKKPLQKKQ